MLIVRLCFVSEWRIWPVVTKCGCLNGPGIKITLIPFIELFITKEVLNG